MTARKLNKILELCVNGAKLNDLNNVTPPQAVDTVGASSDGSIIVLFGEWWLTTADDYDPVFDFRVAKPEVIEEASRVVFKFVDAAYELVLDADNGTDAVAAKQRCARRLLMFDRYVAALANVAQAVGNGGLSFDFTSWVARLKQEPIPSLLPAPREAAAIDAVEIDGTPAGRLVIAPGEADYKGSPILGTLADMWLSDALAPSPAVWLKSYAGRSFQGLILKAPRIVTVTGSLAAVR